MSDEARAEREALKTIRGIVKRNYRDAQDILSIIDIALEEGADARKVEVTVEDVARVIWKSDSSIPGLGHSDSAEIAEALTAKFSITERKAE